MKDGQAEIIVKLLASGRYIWSISVMCGVDATDEGIKLIKSIDNKLKDQWPDYSKRGSGRIANLDED